MLKTYRSGYSFMLSTLSKCMVCVRCAVIKAMSIVNFKVSCFKDSSFADGYVARCSNTTCGFQVSVYLGKTGFKLNSPVKNLDIVGCSPSFLPSSTIKDERALRAAATELYPTFLDNSVRNINSCCRLGFVGQTLFPSQNFIHAET